MTPGLRAASYGTWADDVLPRPGGAVQLSPAIPGSEALEALAPQSLSSLTMLAPPGTIERRAALAHALRALGPDASLTVLAPNDKGGTRLAAELGRFGCRVETQSRRHHRICTAPAPPRPAGLDDAIAAGAPRRVEALDAWTQPGVFSWDRIDPGSALLADTLPRLSGRVADLGCGLGFLARAVLASPAVTAMVMVDVDRRAVECARRNVPDARTQLHWADARDLALSDLDAIVMNPPFHHPSGREDQALGQVLIRAAARMLRKGGSAYVVANRHLAYESTLREHFAQVTPLADRGGFKVLRAVR